MPALRFILGRAGAGKTHCCIDEIVARLQAEPLGAPLLFILPDQATFQMENAIAQTLPSRGFVRLQVLSFKRLALTILGETGGLARPALTQIGRQMLLRSVLQAHEGELKVFGRSARQTGFIAELERMLRELAQCGYDPASARAAAQRLPDSAARHKLEDLAFLWAAYKEALVPHHADPDTYMTMATEAGPACSWLASAEVWVDGFASFTPQEHRLLQMLLAQTRAVHVALCLDPAAWPQLLGAAKDAYRQGDSPAVDPLGMFYRCEDTCARLLLGAHRQQLPIADPTLLQTAPPRFRAPELAHLEKEFSQPLAVAYEGKIQAIQLAEASNRRAEVEAVGREILRLCRDEGYRFRDIGIMARNLDPYFALLSAVFADLQIPCFIDRRTSIAHHPVIELLRSVVEVAATHWHVAPLMRCLKTDLLPFSRDDVDKLENYILEHGLQGAAWRNPRAWSYGTKDADPAQRERVQAVDKLRKQIYALLGPVVEVLAQPAPTAVQACGALYQLFAQIQVAERLEEWSGQSAQAGQIQEAMMHQQVWDACVALLEELVAALGDEEITEFGQILEAGLENLQIGLIPPVLDQVLVGAVDRSRQPHLRAVFVLGVGERVFPASGSEDTLFAELERELLADHDFPLGPKASERALHEQYLGYIAFTRAAQYLWVSYPLANDDGRALTPSPFIARLRHIFPQLPVRQVGNEEACSVAEALPWLTSPRRVAAFAVRSWRSENAAEWLAALRLYEDDRDVQMILPSLYHRHDDAPLDAALAAALIGQPFFASISRFESFGTCPFQHFAQYMLGLAEREEYSVQHTDIGILVHETLHRLVQTLQARQLDLLDVSAAEREQLIDDLVTEIASELHHQVFVSKARYLYLVERIKRLLHTTLVVWLRHSEKGQFRPIATEVHFGGRGEHSLPAPEIALPTGERVYLHGRIDRIDFCQGEEAAYVRVIDYKGSGGKFEVADAYHGLRLQLPLYLDVARRALQGADGAPVLPAGAYYFNVREPTVEATQPLSEEEWEEQLVRKMRLEGLTLQSAEVIRLSEEDGEGILLPARLTKKGAPYKHVLTVEQEVMERLFAFVQERMQDFAGRILAGEIAARPYRYGEERSGCRFCRYHPVCHFDPQIPGDYYRVLEKMGSKESWQRLNSVEAGGISSATVD